MIWTVLIVLVIAGVHAFVFALAAAAGAADAWSEAAAHRRHADRMTNGVMAEIRREDQFYRALLEEYEDPYAGADDPVERGQGLKEADAALESVAARVGATWLLAEGGPGVAS